MRKGMGSIWAAVLLLAAVVMGCERRPLEYMYRQTIRVVVKCIWEADAYPEGEKPTGMTLYFFKDGAFFNSITTSNVDSCEVELERGRYALYMISQSVDEYGSMEFHDMSNFQKASSVLEAAPADWASRGPGELVVQDPEVLLSGVTEEFEITEDMTRDYQTYYRDWYNKKQAMAAAEAEAATKSDIEDLAYLEEQVQYRTVRIPLYPRNVVSQFWVTIYAGNADVLQSVRASTTGMARTFDLTQNVTDVEKATQIIRYWTLNMDDEDRRVGHVDGLITTFGLPEGETPSTMRDSTLNVSALLIDNETVADYVFNVGDKIQELTPNRGYRNLYRLIFGSVDDPAIQLPDVTPVESGGGFTADVTDWDDEIKADIPI
mgnify:CR=1 FL=1